MDDLEAQLIAKAKRGDSSAAPFLVSYFGERLLGYARAHAPDLSDADREQIVALAIEAGVRVIGRFDPEKGTLRSWFRAQVRYKTLDWRRANPLSVPLDPEVAHEPIPLERPPASIEALRRAIGRLGREDQVMLALRDSESLDYREIAQRLGIAEDTARQRHRRALGRLRAEALKESELHHLSDPPADPGEKGGDRGEPHA